LQFRVFFRGPFEALQTFHNNQRECRVRPYDLDVASTDCTRGSVAVTEVPLPSFEVMLKRPPEFLIRSDIPDSPNPWFVIDPTTKPHPLSFTERRTIVGDALSST
jgi:hypothetical protein